MAFSGFFNTVESDSWPDNSPAENCQGFLHLRLAFAASPEHPPEPLPDPNPGFEWTQPSPIYPSARDMSPHHNPHTPFYFHDQPVQSHIPFFNPQSFGPMPTVMPNTHQLSATLNAGHSSMQDGLQGCFSAVGSSPIHDASYYPQDHSMCAQPHYNGSRVFVDQTKLSNSAAGTPYRQIQPAPAGVVRGSLSVPSALALQPMVSRFPTAQVPTRRNSRGNRSVTSPPYHPIRTSSLPVQSVSPTETLVRICQWMGDDGTTCGAPITAANVSEHLTIHDVKDKAHNFSLSCRWLGCRLRGGKDTMKRESILRHVRERHLGWKRPLK